MPRYSDDPLPDCCVLPLTGLLCFLLLSFKAYSKS